MRINMNLKYYLRGLGLGLIVTTIILSVSRNFGSGQDDKKNDVSQIQNSTGSVIAFTRGQEETTASMENDTRQEETTNQTEPSTEALTQPETTKAAEPETTSKAVEPTTQEPTKAPEENGSVTIVIKDVYYGTQAADILYDAGLITDKSDFIQYLIATGYGSIIQEGVYSIDKGASYEVICKTISRK